jgi:hypothetical protein
MAGANTSRTRHAAVLMRNNAALAARIAMPALEINSQASIEWKRLLGLDGFLPGGQRSTSIARVHGVRGAPVLQFIKRPAKIIEHLTVHVLELASGRHDSDQARDRLDDEAIALLAHTRHLRPAQGTRESSRVMVATVRANQLFDRNGTTSYERPADCGSSGRGRCQSRCSGSFVPATTASQP